MLQDNLGGMHPVMFHDHLTHSIVADGICSTYARSRGELRLTPVSAGFYSEDTMEVSGHSDSLGLDSVSTDALYIVLGGAVSHLPPIMLQEAFNRLMEMKR